jgi:hypothetical protein
MQCPFITTQMGTTVAVRLFALLSKRSKSMASQPPKPDSPAEVPQDNPITTPEDPPTFIPNDPVETPETIPAPPD